MKTIKNPIIAEILDDIIDKNEDARKINNNEGDRPAFMPFNIDKLYYDRSRKMFRFAFSHYYKQHGDMIPDPDMEVYYNRDTGELAAVTYQDTYKYEDVFENEKKPDERLQRSLTTFLRTWLNNVVEQQHLNRNGNGKGEEPIINTEADNSPFITRHDIKTDAIRLWIGEDKRTRKDAFDNYCFLADGMLKVDNGIRHLTERYKKIDLNAIKHDLRKAHISPRPYVLGQPCDGSIDSPVHALYYHYCKHKDIDPETLYKTAYPNEEPPNYEKIKSEAEWQGVTYPEEWNDAAFNGLLESLTEINNHSLVSALTDYEENKEAERKNGGNRNHAEKAETPKTAKKRNGKKVKETAAPEPEPLTLATFIEKFKGAIADNIHKRFSPLYTLDMNTEQMDLQIDELTIRKPGMERPLFDAQAHITKAGKILLHDHNKRCLFVIGEMGTGKTTVSNALIHISNGKAKNNLIVCPPHLVKKWEREIRETYPKETSLQVFQIRNITDFEKAKREAEIYIKTFFILSRERAKLSYYWKPDYLLLRKEIEREIKVTDQYGYTRKEKETVTMDIPHCPKCRTMIVDNRTGTVIDESKLRHKKLWCQHEYTETIQAGDNSFIKVKKQCRTPLWKADREGPRRYAIADYISKRYRNYFDTLILDEVQDYKSMGSAQGQASGTLAGACRKTIAMTGTIFGGRSSSLFYLLYRFSPEFKKIFKYNQETEFVKKYGIQWKIQRESTTQEDGRSSKRKISPVRIEEKPGISPEIILYLIDKAVFVSLEDIDENLPPYVEKPHEIKMLPEQEATYMAMETSFKRKLAKALAKGDKRLLSLYLQTCLTFPDIPTDPNTIYPKEQDLIDTVKAERSQGRKVLVYCTHTDKRDITPRLRKILEDQNMKVEVLKAHIPAEKREAWIADRVKDGLDVLICNSELVKTGLDLIDFPTIYNYETSFNIYTMRQASRRSWRIGQTQNVQVIFACYQGTMQERALSLIAKKLKAAEMLDGELQEEGISSYQDEGSLLVEIAKSMVNDIKDLDTLEGIFNSKKQIEKESKGFIGYDSTRKQEPRKEVITESNPKAEESTGASIDLWNVLYEQKKATVLKRKVQRQSDNVLSLF